MNLIIQKAFAHWKGGKASARTLTTGSSALLQSRFSSGIPLETDTITNPVELIAAAQASSFSLALAKELELKSAVKGEIITTATVTLEHLAAGWTIMNLHLNVAARLPKVTQSKFIDATVRAKTNCLVSRLLRVTISMTAKLEK